MKCKVTGLVVAIYIYIFFRVRFKRGVTNVIILRIKGLRFLIAYRKMSGVGSTKVLVLWECV